MNRLIEWRSALWSRGPRACAQRGPDAQVLSPAQARELEHPTYLRRGLAIHGLPGFTPRSASADGARG